MIEYNATFVKPVVTSMSNCFKYILFLFAIIFHESCGSEPKVTVDQSETMPEIQQLSALIQQDPNDAILYFERAKMYNFHENYEAAKSDLQKSISLDSNNIEAWHLLADIELDNFQSYDALSLMRQAGNRFAEQEGTQLKLAEFQLILKQYDEAMSTLNRLLEEHPRNPEAFFMKGLVYRELRDTANAKKMLQLATREDPEIIDAWLILGELAIAGGDSQALEYFEAILEIEPRNEAARYGIGQHWLNSGEYKKALAVYQQIQELNQFDANAYFNIGIAYLELDSLDLAHKHFDIAVQSEPSFATAYLYRGFVNELKGSLEKAMIDYENTLKVDPTEERAEEGINRLKTLITQ